MSEEENLRPMNTLDDVWNNQDWDTFSERHTEDVIAIATNHRHLV
jgi:hypothetical protein